MNGTTHAPAWRRQCLRLERGTVEPEEFQAYLLRAWQVRDDSLTPEQWREIGKWNGVVS